MSQALDELRQTIARLRAPGGCPWDQEQTHESLVRCLIDEASELIETIDRADMPHMREELGDVLMQVVFHAQLAEEAGHFDLDDVTREVNAKLIRRHPHVFGDEAAGRPKIETTAQLFVQWDAIKAEEKRAKENAVSAAAPATLPPELLRSPRFKALPPRLPALMFAEAVWKQARKKDLTTTAPLAAAVDAAQVAQRAATLDDEQLGRALFELCAAAQQAGLNPEDVLRRWTARLVDRAEAAASTPHVGTPHK